MQESAQSRLKHSTSITSKDKVNPGASLTRTPSSLSEKDLNASHQSYRKHKSRGATTSSHASHPGHRSVRRCAQKLESSIVGPAMNYVLHHSSISRSRSHSPIRHPSSGRGSLTSGYVPSVDSVELESPPPTRSSRLDKYQYLTIQIPALLGYDSDSESELSAGADYDERYVPHIVSCFRSDALHSTGGFEFDQVG